MSVVFVGRGSTSRTWDRFEKQKRCQTSFSRHVAFSSSSSLKLSCAVENSEHVDFVLLDFIEQSITLDEKLANAGIIQFRYDPATF